MQQGEVVYNFGGTQYVPMGKKSSTKVGLGLKVLSNYTLGKITR